MSYDFFSMNTISENAVLHHRLFYCVRELFRAPENHRRPQLSRSAQLLHELGMPSSLSGYRFLEFAMITLAEQPHLLKNLAADYIRSLPKSLTAPKTGLRKTSAAPLNEHGCAAMLP